MVMMVWGILAVLVGQGSGRNLAQNSGFEVGTGKTPLVYALSGGARWGRVNWDDEFPSLGVLMSGEAAEVSQVVPLRRRAGKWVTFRFRGLPMNGFAVMNDALWMRIDFLADGGTRRLETAKRLIYREVMRDRQDLDINGDRGVGGAAVWRSYDFEELLPFKEVDSVRVSVGLKDGVGNGRFLVDDFSVEQRAKSLTGRVDPLDRAKPNEHPVDVDSRLVHLGGRWYYEPAAGEKVEKRLFVTYRNADRLLYKGSGFVAPFAGNMTSWLKPGFLDRNSQVVTTQRFLPDNVTITFDGSDKFQIRTKNIPNHPTAKFPDTYGTQGYNPGYIKEQDRTFWVKVDPKLDKKAIAMDENDSNFALNMGPVGIAVNGVVFFNPFDGNMSDATSLMDRCCGHPAPQMEEYHYHKYPICVNTPYADKGDAHSPIIGFALDGFPVYGPYESSGVLARDLKTNKLNAFNAHYDSERGWHYHVTPGKFPYIIGGYMGWSRNQQ